MKITMTKVGSFSTDRNRASTTQCGTQGMTVFQYEVEITTTQKKLNPKTGFIVDNADIAGYFDNYHVYEEKTESCELIACKAAAHFHTVLKNQGVQVNRIKVRIQGSLTAFFVADFNVKKLKKKNKTGFVGDLEEIK